MDSQEDNMGFLHRHPGMERSLGLDDKHVIVDKEDWEVVRGKRDQDYIGSRKGFKSIPLSTYLPTNGGKVECLHDMCTRCNGTGLDASGGMCVHNIYCSCSKCSHR